jgi:hypothetical protein
VAGTAPANPIAGAAAIVTVSVVVTVSFVGVPESVMVKTGLYVPAQAAVMLPVIKPPVLMLRHGGNVPEVTVQVEGLTPPLPDN